MVKIFTFFGDTNLLQVLKFIASVFDKNYAKRLVKFGVLGVEEPKGYEKFAKYDERFKDATIYTPVKIYVKSLDLTLNYMSIGPPLSSQVGLEDVNFISLEKAFSRLQDSTFSKSLGPETAVILNSDFGWENGHLKNLENHLNETKHLVKNFKNNYCSDCKILYKSTSYIRGNFSDFADSSSFYVNYLIDRIIKKTFTKDSTVEVFDTFRMTETVFDYLEVGKQAISGRYWILQAIAD